MTALLRTCIYLTFGGSPVIDQAVVPGDAPWEELHCSGTQQTDIATHYLRVERSHDLVHWTTFAQGEFPDYTSITIIESIDAPASFLRVSILTP